MTIRARTILAGLAAMAGLGIGQAPAPSSVPAPAKEYTAPASQSHRRVKRKRKLPPLHGFNPKFPITRDVVAGSCNTYRLGALHAFRLGELNGKDAERLQRAYCESVHNLRKSRGSQAIMRAREVA